jgi:hypothetical protein
MVSSVYLGSPYAVVAAKSDLTSTILRVRVMTCDVPAADCDQAGFFCLERCGGKLPRVTGWHV